ncbi:hypothetical protein [Clostridium beijerinckii]|uniref:hypothetical protein n=1 Tax=Clostridium beijerinckii TaxID=1520 RepID=UPI001494CB41|nr:hypothetical protein [Clostridium beijerinckii]NOW06713.1 hypothetical protein [Clostridium beijerinckii]NYC00142.1 hypothetical protein [Clostridium beijerinckii]
MILASKIVFISKDIVYEENDKEVSILKLFSLANEYFINLKQTYLEMNLKRFYTSCMQ